jgi:predicted GNAT family acetyltransferase
VVSGDLNVEPQLELSDNREQARYEARVDGELAAFSEYQRSDDRIIFTHTETLTPFQERGIGGRLVAYALDDARSLALHVVSRCSFVSAYIRSHPEYAD